MATAQLDVGAGQDQITFAHLMTHTSGLKQLFNLTGVGGTDYAGLRDLAALDSVVTIEDGVFDQGPPYPRSYSNLNFAVLRVVVAGLLGLDPVDYPEFESGPLTAAVFEFHLQSVYSAIGVPTSCAPTDPEPTLMYKWPHDGITNGAESSSKILVCGGYGFFISAHHLDQVLVHLRHTENLLSEQQFDLMVAASLGFQDDLFAGDYGTYVGHGGHWNPRMQTCAIMFPIAVEAAITVNSVGGDHAQPCVEAGKAFDGAWVKA